MVRDSLELSVADGMATLIDCTVDTIKQSLKILPKKPKVLMIVGGGLNNKFLIKQIKNKIDIPLLNAKKTNISFDFIESELMALLGARRLNNLPITFPLTTGAYKPISGGEIYNYK